MNIKELFQNVEEEIMNGNTELKELQSKISFLSKLLPNEGKLISVLDSRSGLYNLVYKKKREFFFEAVEVFKNFHKLTERTKDTVYTGLLEIMDNIEEDCFYKDKEYEMENKIHRGIVSDYEAGLSETEKKIFSEIINIDALYYEIYSNLLFETMLIVSGLLNSMEKTKKRYFRRII